MSDTPIFQVSELNEVLNRHLSLLGEVVVEGELSRFDVNNGRLIFSTIKDSKSSLDLFSLTHIVRSYSQFEPGMLVQVHGEPGLYKGSGKFRLFVKHITPVGEGSLQIAFEKLKAKLEAEGLFDDSHKRLLPEWPQNIGLITAKDSSAYHDVVKILSARMSGLTIKHLPVTVQGASAPGTILKALTYCNQHPDDFDLIILTRGGGSLEDLAAFNDEEVARAVFGSRVPIISAIGHEDDLSLTDFVADLRASTPSNAAELAVKDRQLVLRDLDSHLYAIEKTLQLKLRERQQTVSRSIHNITSATATLTHRVNQTIATFKRQLTIHRDRLVRQEAEVGQKAQALKKTLIFELRSKRQDVISLNRLLDSLDYKNVLKRGYSITRDDSGHILKDPKSVKAGESITTQLAKGELASTVN